MSFLIPSINSKNPKRAWNAFRFVTRSDEEVAGMLRREDVVIRDRIFEWAAQHQSGVLDLLRDDSDHPYHSKAMELRERAEAALEAEKIRLRQTALRRITEADRAGEPRDVMRAADTFHSHYEATEEEKAVIAEAVYRAVCAAVPQTYKREERDGLMLDHLGSFVCPAFLEAHLLELPEAPPRWMQEKIRAALHGTDIPAERKREACLRYRIHDAALVTACEVGKHELVPVRRETEENHEDYCHPYTYQVCRCKNCGFETRYEVKY